MNLILDFFNKKYFKNILSFIQELNKNIGDLYYFRVILIGIIVFSIPLWILDQGQDLLININSSAWGVPFLLASLASAAIINWYLAKFFFKENANLPLFPLSLTETSGKKNYYERKISRFLGVLTILSPAFAFLNVQYLSEESGNNHFFQPFPSLLICLVLFYLMIKYEAAERFLKWIGKKNGSIVFTLLILLFLLGIPLLNLLIICLLGINNTPLSLNEVFWNIISLSLAFYLFISVRLTLYKHWVLFGEKIGILVLILVLINSLFFLLVNFSPEIPFFIKLYLGKSSRILALSILLSGIIFYIVCFALLIRFSQKKKINFTLIFFLIAIVVSVFHKNDYHAVNVSFNKVSNFRKPDSLNEYFKKWVLARKSEIKTGYPVFLVNTYGGGIRASAFTNYFLTFMDKVYLQNSKKKGFEHYTFSFSGASGGTVGAAVQSAFRSKYKENPNAYNLGTITEFYLNDFLSSVLATNLGRDLWASITGLFWWSDRSVVQEKVWVDFAKNLKDPCNKKYNINLNSDFDSLWYSPNSSYEVPLLFSNSLNVDNGLKGIYAPVLLDSNNFSNSIFIRGLIKPLNCKFYDEPSYPHISLITGSFLSARFPFVSPTGKMGPDVHFTDGGGSDNSGASTSDQIFSSIIKYIKNLPKSSEDSDFKDLFKKLRFYFVSIKNDLPSDTVRKFRESSFELLRPVMGIVNSGIFGNEAIADSNLSYKYRKSRKNYILIGKDTVLTNYFSIRPTISKVPVNKIGSYKPILPLGWQISGSALKSLENAFEGEAIQPKKIDPNLKGLMDLAVDSWQK